MEKSSRNQFTESKYLMRLKLDNLSIGYDFPLQKDINLALQEGELVAIVGRNGSGKSTLIKTLAGIELPIAGNVFVDDKKLGLKEIPKFLSIVLTDKPIENFKVEEILSLGRLPYTSIANRLSDMDKLIIDKIISRLHLEEIQKRSFGQLSDGEKQIVMIARAVIQETPIIILDEPMTHLDLENKARVLKLLKELVAKGKLVIFSSHDLNLIIPEVDKYIILHEKVYLAESKEELKKLFKELFDKRLLKFDEKEMRFKLV